MLHKCLNKYYIFVLINKNMSADWLLSPGMFLILDEMSNLLQVFLIFFPVLHVLCRMMNYQFLNLF